MTEQHLCILLDGDGVGISRGDSHKRIGALESSDFHILSVY